MTSTDSLISSSQHKKQAQKCASIWICHFLEVGVRRVIFQLHQETSKKRLRLPSDLGTSLSYFDPCALCFINFFASLRGLRAECAAGTHHYIPVTVHGSLTWLLASYKLSFTCSYRFLSSWAGCLVWTWLTCGWYLWPESSLTSCWALAWISECCVLLRGLKLMTKYNTSTGK